jgi:hypothetical protein
MKLENNFGEVQLAAEDPVQTLLASPRIGGLPQLAVAPLTKCRQFAGVLVSRTVSADM